MKSKEQCCGCGACYNACPADAIKMHYDEFGFEFPEIDSEKCINCGRCVKTCSFIQNGVNSKTTRQAYAFCSNDKDVYLNSSSGGAFYQIASAVLDNNGVVYGTKWDLFDLKVSRIDTISELRKLQGSKYAQSSTGLSYRDVQSDLTNGKAVLFSGTPCQVSGLYSFLGKDYNNLVTIDIICHGVPSCKMLKDDLKIKGELSCIKNIQFRDKKRGWGTLGSYELNGKKRKYDASNSAYYYLFLKGMIYRDSCYHCRFPSDNRCGDITIGDYWGVGKKHADLFDVRRGVSCVLINSKRGEDTILSLKNSTIVPTDEDNVRKNNAQLNRCTEEPVNRRTIMDIYKNMGWFFVEKYWKKKEFFNRKKLMIKNMIPYNLKSRIKRLR